MIGWLARVLLFRILPRKLVPIITVIEIGRMLVSMRRRRFSVNDPMRSRTAPPPHWPPRPELPQRRR
ncbi:MAG TPA: hypothetical protein VFV72_12365 [Candidatus Limnocylindrales bacterium]|nr:hypothetical protein [Candidatus Limnocylindrales bacterium]